MKSCIEIREMISLYIDDLLEEKESAEFLEHIEECPECRQELEELSRIISLCKEDDELELPDNFKEELHTKLVEVKQEYKQKKNVFMLYAKYVKIASSIAAVLAIIFITVLMTVHNGGRASYSTSTAEPKNFALDDNVGTMQSDSSNQVRVEKSYNGKESSNYKLFEDYGAEEKNDTNYQYNEANVKKEKSDDLTNQSAPQATLTLAAPADIIVNVGNIKTEYDRIQNELKSLDAVFVPEISAINGTGTGSTDNQVADKKQLRLKEQRLEFTIPVSKVDEFTQWLKSTYGEKNIEMVSTYDENAIKEQINQLQKQLDDINKSIQELLAKNNKENAEKLSDLYIARDSVASQLEAAKNKLQNRSFVIVIRQKQ